MKFNRIAIITIDRIAMFIVNMIAMITINIIASITIDIIAIITITLESEVWPAFVNEVLYQENHKRQTDKYITSIKIGTLFTGADKVWPAFVNEGAYYCMLYYVKMLY